MKVAGAPYDDSKQRRQGGEAYPSPIVEARI